MEWISVQNSPLEYFILHKVHFVLLFLNLDFSPFPPGPQFPYFFHPEKIFSVD